MPAKKIGVKVFLGTYSATLFIQACTIAQGFLLARLLGPEGRGEFAAIILWPTFFATIGSMGLEVAIARRAGKTEDLVSLTAVAVILGGGTSLLTCTICFFFIPVLLPVEMSALKPLVYLFTAYIPLRLVSLNLLGIDQGSRRFFSYNVSRVVLYPVYLLGLLLTWFYAENRMLWVVCALLAGNLAVLGSLLVPRIPDLFKRGKRFFAIKIFKEGLPFQLTTLSIAVVLHVDHMILVWLLEPVYLGFYAVAKSASSIVSGLVSSLEIMSFSQAVQLNRKTGFYPLATMVRRGVFLSFFLSLCLAPVIYYFVPVLYGVEFIKASTLAIILIVGCVFSGGSSIIDQAFCGHGKPLFGVISRFTSVVVFVVLAIKFSVEYGVHGIAVSYILSQLICFVSNMLFALWYFDGTMLHDFFPQRSDFVYFMKKISNGKDWILTKIITK